MRLLKRLVKYANNHTHTEYSNLRLLDCINKVNKLVDYAIEIGYSSISITDHCSLSSHVQCMKKNKELKEKGIDFKINLGDEIYLVDDVTDTVENYQGGVTKFHHFILVAKDAIGYEQLRRIDSLCWDNSFYTGKMRRTFIDRSQMEEIIDEDKGHLVATTACFTKGHKVLTSKGEKNIEDIEKGEFVLTHDGTYQKVITPTSRYYNDGGRVIEFSRNSDKITCTNNHKFLVYNNKEKNTFWTEAKNLKEKDICLDVADKFIFTNNKTLDLKEILSTNTNKNHVKFHVKETINLTDKVMRFFGYWLADGHVRFNKTKSIGLTINEKEFDSYYKDFIRPFINEVLGEDFEPYIHKRPENGRVDVDINCSELAYVFYNLFENGKSGTKFIPNEIKNISREHNIELLFGYLLGDGYFRDRLVDEKYHSGEIVSATISKPLNDDIIDLYNSIGLSPNTMITCEKTDKKGVSHQQAYYLALPCKDFCHNINKNLIPSHSFLVKEINKLSYDKRKYVIINGKYYLKKLIKKIENVDIKEKVYCLSVENNHNFICNGIIVHNCLGGQLANLFRQYENSEHNIIEKHKIHDFISWCKNMFPNDFAFEMQPSFDEEQISYNKFLIKMSECYNIPLVIHTDAHYLKAEDKDVHMAFLTSREADRGEGKDFYATTYLMSVGEIWEYFEPYMNEDSFLQAIENSYNLTKDCEIIDMEHGTIVPERDLSEINFSVMHIFKEWYDKCPSIKDFAYSDFEQDRYLLYMIEVGFLEKKQEFNEENIFRVNTELEEIWGVSENLQQRVSAYYNLVDYIVDICWEIGFVGISRGSVTGYYTMYLIDMQQMNPIKWNLPHWRHLTKERPEMPRHNWASNVNVA